MLQRCRCYLPLIFIYVLFVQINPDGRCVVSEKLRIDESEMVLYDAKKQVALILVCVTLFQKFSIRHENCHENSIRTTMVSKMFSKEMYTRRQTSPS